MIPILSNEAVRTVEEVSRRKQGISSLELMERAGQACTDRLVELVSTGQFGSSPSFHVLAGMGNNGGDGLVIARLLAARSFPVRVTMIHHREGATPENLANLEMLSRSTVPVDHIHTSNEHVQISDNELIIDCILGAGSTRAVTGWLTQLIDRVNASRCPVVAIDLPTGMMSYLPDDLPAACIRARRTLTIQVPRPKLLLADSGEVAGTWELIPIGLDQEALLTAERWGEWMQQTDISSLVRPKPRFAHKGTFGHALLVAGSAGFHGAALLAACGCARSGVGLLTVHATKETLSIIGQQLPDAMTSLDPGEGSISQVPDLQRTNTVGIGPGLGMDPNTIAMLRDLLEVWNGPIVLDADALNIIACERDLLGALHPNAVLTPHPKEMDRLLGTRPPSANERFMAAKAFAKEHGCTIVLKGAYSAICSPDGRVCFNPTGNAGMAKGGSGDVLTGLLTGLLAQGYPPMDACLIGVYLHGLAGDVAAEALGMDAMRASDLVDHLPEAWKRTRMA